jgi:hypothetical protein
MDDKETSHYAIQAVLRATTREDFEPKIGRLDKVMPFIERKKRYGIPINY